MIYPYFTFTTDNKNLCCYKTSAILNVNFYIDLNDTIYDATLMANRVPIGIWINKFKHL